LAYLADVVGVNVGPISFEALFDQASNSLHANTAACFRSIVTLNVRKWIYDFTHRIRDHYRLVSNVHNHVGAGELVHHYAFYFAEGHCNGPTPDSFPNLNVILERGHMQA